MKQVLLRMFFLLAIGGAWTACKKDYIVGGSAENANAYKDLATYDVLKSLPLYDTLVQLIDTAGLKDKLNEQGATFFAPSDYSIYSYLNQRTIQVQNADPSAKFALDSLFYYLRNNIDGTKDSLLMYLIHQPLPYSALTNTGSFYATELTGDTVIVSYEYTKDGNLGYNPLVSGVPQVVYFTQLWQPYDLSDANPAGDITPDIGIHTICTTSGVITKTGTINALSNSHTLFFYGTR
ncbi:MAG TPA: hypothetical protein VGM31_17820 [Puia sp.]